MDKQIEEFLTIYISETREILSRFSDCLLVLEKDSKDINVINDLFRYLHTLKGNSSLDGFEKITSIAHVLENIFELMRDGKIILETSHIDTFFHALDVLDGLVNGLINLDYDLIDTDDIILELKSIVDINNKTNILMPQKKTIGVLKLTALQKQEIESKVSNDLKCYLVDLTFNDEETGALNAYIIMTNLKALSAFYYSSPVENELINTKNLAKCQILLFSNRAKPEIEAKIISNCKDFFVIETSPAKIPTDDGASVLISAKKEETKPSDIKSSVTDNISAKETVKSVSVEVDKYILEGVIESIGEMILNMNFIGTLAGEIFESESIDIKELKEQIKMLYAQVQGTVLLCNSLMDYAFHLRLMPLKPLFRKLPRIVRDAAKKVNKKVSLEMFGENIRVDQEVMNMLEGPVMHILRNCIDHGIEESDDRIKSGKSETGVITITAKQRERDVVIEIKDDGAGIDSDKVVKKAIQKKLITKAKVKDLKENDIFNFIFHPGFSTKENAGELSGRGVGMDVVLHEIQKIRGKIDISSKKGEGTKFTLTLPIVI